MLGQKSHHLGGSRRPSLEPSVPSNMEVILADYPCDFHLARYQGPSHRLYLNVYREDQVIKLKASLCGECLVTALDEWLPHFIAQTSAGGWDPVPEGSGLDCLWQASDGLPRAFDRAARR